MCVKILSKNKISTGLCYRLYSSYFVLALNPKRFFLQPPGRNSINGSCLAVSMILPRVEKVGSFVNG